MARTGTSLPSNLYSGGAVVFNTQPETNLYGQVLAKQQAKREAMDNYERSRINSINDAGLRDIDRKTLDDKLADLKSFYNQNKPFIQKGNSKQAFDYESKFRDVRDLIAKSKDLAMRHEAAMKFYNDRLKADQRLPDDFINELHFNDLPVGGKDIHPKTGQVQENTPFDLTKWSSEPRPFVQDKYLKEFNDIKRTPTLLPYQKTDDPARLNEVTEEKFDNGAKQVIAARAADKYDNSYSFSAQVQDEIKDPIRRKQLGDLFKNEYGTDPTLPSDYAAAFTLEKLQPSLIKTKTVPNTAYTQQFQLNKMAIAEGYKRNRAYLNDALVKSRINFRKTLDENEQDNVLNTFIENQFNAGNDKIPFVNIGNQKYEGRIVDVPKSIKDKYIEDVSTEKDQFAIKKAPDAWFMTNDKSKIIPLYFGEQRKSGSYNIKAGVSKPIDIQNYKTQLLPILNKKGGENVVDDEFPKEETKQIKQPKPTSSSYQIKGKKYSEKELLDMGYNLDQIKPYKQ